MSVEDFTTAIIADGGGRYTITPTKIIVNAATRADNNQHVAFDKGVGGISGDFTHRIQVTVTAQAFSGALPTWVLSNALESVIPDTDNMWVDWFDSSFRLIEQVSDSITLDVSIGLSLNTKYYLVIPRDVNIGAFGQLTCFIYDNMAETSLVDTLQILLNKDETFRYAYGTDGYESGNASQTVSAEIENLDLGAAAAAVGGQIINGGIAGAQLINGGIISV